MPIMTRYSRKLLYAGLTGAAIAGVLTAGGSYLFHRSTLEEEAVLKSALQHKVTLLEEEKCVSLNC